MLKKRYLQEIYLKLTDKLGLCQSYALIDVGQSIPGGFNMKILISGQARYIGSRMVRYAQDNDHEVVVLDDFSTGHEWAVKDYEILRVNFLDQSRLSKLIKDWFFDGVIHFAAKSLVGGSVKKPELYYRNNVQDALNLISEIQKTAVNNLVFSSKVAIFGNPVADKISHLRRRLFWRVEKALFIF